MPGLEQKSLPRKRRVSSVSGQQTVGFSWVEKGVGSERMRSLCLVSLGGSSDRYGVDKPAAIGMWEITGRWPFKM